MDNDVNHALKTAATNDEKFYMLKIYMSKKQKKEKKIIIHKCMSKK